MIVLSCDYHKGFASTGILDSQKARINSFEGLNENALGDGTSLGNDRASG
jgi:hypothetical protein